MIKKFIVLSVILQAFTLLKAEEIPFRSGEELYFNLNYKYGLMMIKAGTAEFNIQNSHYSGVSTMKTVLTFKTNSFFDKIFKMRDTLYSQVDMSLAPLYHFRTVNEGNTTFIEEMFVRKYNSKQTEVRVRRESSTIASFDTILYADAPGYDMLNLILYARSLNFGEMTVGDKKRIATFVGRDMINILVRYKGIETADYQDSEKNCHRIAFDIVDAAFKESKDAIEIWLSEDKNHVPVRIKAKLKIGAAEVRLASVKNLKFEEEWGE